MSGMESYATVREATNEDLPEVLAGYEWLFAPPGTRPARWESDRALTTLRQLRESSTTTVLVADVDSVVAGFATVYLDIRSVRFGQRAWVEDLAVSPDHRSRGVGRVLLDAAKGWAHDHGASHLGLNSSVARRDAHRFYERERPDARSISFSWDLP